METLLVLADNVFGGDGMRILTVLDGRNHARVIAESLARVIAAIRKRGLLEKGSSQKSPFSRDSRELRDFRESPNSGNKVE